MQRVFQVSLNRNAYSIEQEAHARLEAYLAESAAALGSDPDRDEILLDLEQAIADQCKRRMPPQASVITLAELASALEEIGPVKGEPIKEDATAGAAAPNARPPLQQISQGAWVSGVCLGLARHLGVEVTLMRVVATILLFFTGGAALLLYGALMLLMPYAAIDPSGPPPRKLPAKMREWTEALRGKLGQMAR